MTKDIVKVYRVADSDDEGMYRGNSEACDQMFEDARHPNPLSDNGLMRNLQRFYPNVDVRGDILGWYDIAGDYLWAFSSMEQLRFWIYRDEWRKELHDLGQRIHVYEVPRDRVVFGETQAMVPKCCEWTKVEELKLTEL